MEHRFALLVLAALTGASCTDLKTGSDQVAGGASGAGVGPMSGVGGVTSGSGGASGLGGSAALGGASPRDADANGEGSGGAVGSPDPRDGGTGGVLQLASGSAHTCALLDGGRVRCWGWGLYGVLGYGNEQNVGDNETPASMGDVNVGGKVIQIAAGANHTCAVLEGGRVRCWGWGIGAQLGYGNVENVGDNEVPADVGDVDVGGKVVQIGAGDQHTCVLLETGAVRCWGSGDRGQLGYANTNMIGDDEKPSSAGDVNVGGKVVEIAVGGANTCARLESGAIRCWGPNLYGQLGYGNTKNIGDDETPAWAGNVDVGGPVAQVSFGTQFACAILVGGSLRCWGTSPNGQLGYGNIKAIGDDEAPSTAGDVNVGAKVLRVNAGDYHTCAIVEGNALRCWGRNDLGQLGYGHTRDIGDDEVPATAGDVNVGGPVVQVEVGGATTCALLVGGHVRCWGGDVGGALGYGRPLGGPIGDDETPATAGDVPVD
jgi:alpha-tubulin suppressor-like RCC1 family protein